MAERARAWTRRALLTGLVTGVIVSAAVVPAGAVAVGEPSGDGGTSSDVLRSNGLRSPWCTARAGIPGVGFFVVANCKTSGISSVSGAGDDVQFDWHVDTDGGVLGSPDLGATFSAWILNVMAIIWSLMVAITKVAFLAVEFALGFNPLDGRHGSRALAGLPEEVRTISGTIAVFTAVMGAITIIWSAIGEQRVAEALSSAVLGFCLATVILVVLANPFGTVGAAITSSQKLGLYVIGATANAQPAAGTRSAQQGLQAMGDAVVDQPLAMLEFGDVDWGTNPSRLDRKLQQAAIALATKEENPERLRLVRDARTNLRLFEAWPANSPQRNSINQDDSLLHFLCGSDDAKNCKGPNAARAEFRSDSGKWQRVTALLLIAFPLLMFWLCMFFVAYKVLGAMLMSVIFLMQLVFIGPFAIAGKMGVERVVRFGGSYLGAILSACTYSFFLALLMSVWRFVSGLTGYGWAVQWLLLGFALLLLLIHHKALWGQKRQLDHTLGAVGHRGAWMLAGFAANGARSARRGAGARQGRHGPRRGGLAPAVAHRARPGTARNTVSGGRTDAHGSSVVATPPRSVAFRTPSVPRSKLPWRDRPAPRATFTPTVAAGPPTDRQLGRAKRERKQQVTALLAARRADTEAAGPPDVAPLTALRDKVTGLRQDAWRDFQEEQTPAARRRKGERVKRLVEDERALHASVDAAWVAANARSAPTTDAAVKRDRRDAANFLDRQYKLARGVGVESGLQRTNPAAAPRGGPYRDYAALAGLAQSTPAEYRAAKPERQVRLRTRIDRELRGRAQGHAVIHAAKAADPGKPKVRAPRPTAGRSHQGARPRVNVRDAATRAATPPDN